VRRFCCGPRIVLSKLDHPQPQIGLDEDRSGEIYGAILRAGKEVCGSAGKEAIQR
jgi:hypothetical protein